GGCDGEAQERGGGGGGRPPAARAVYGSSVAASPRCAADRAAVKSPTTVAIMTTAASWIHPPGSAGERRAAKAAPRSKDARFARIVLRARSVATSRLPAASASPPPSAPRQASCGPEIGWRRPGGSIVNSGSRAPSGTKRASSTMPGTPQKSVIRKNVRQPTASTRKPVSGPARRRGRPNRLEKSAYCVAEKRFSVRRRRSTEKAPVPNPEVSISKPVAAYIS